MNDAEQGVVEVVIPGGGAPQRFAIHVWSEPQPFGVNGETWYWRMRAEPIPSLAPEPSRWRRWLSRLLPEKRR